MGDVLQSAFQQALGGIVADAELRLLKYIQYSHPRFTAQRQHANLKNPDWRNNPVGSCRECDHSIKDGSRDAT